MKLYTDAFDLFIRIKFKEIKDLRPGTLRNSYINLDEGVTALLGIIEGGEEHILQSILFCKTKHNFNTATKWLKANKGTIWDEKDLKFSKDKEQELIYTSLNDKINDKLLKMTDSNLKELLKQFDDLWGMLQYRKPISRELLHHNFYIAYKEAQIRGLKDLKFKILNQKTLDKLDLGCGIKKAPGHVGLDIKRLKDVDIVADINGKIPAADSSFDVIRAYNILEYLRPENKISFMEEVFRVLKPMGELRVRVNSTDGRSAFMSPHYLSYWNESSFYFFNGLYKNTMEDYNFKYDILDLKTKKLNQDTYFVLAVMRAIK